MDSKPLSRRQEQAALLVAEDKATDAAIASRMGIAKRTLERWKGKPDFAARVEQHRAAWHRAATQEGMADGVGRIRALKERVAGLSRVIEERAADPHFQPVPGGRTGFLTQRARIVGSGEKARVVWEHPLDVALLRELRALERQLAQEVDAWHKKAALSKEMDAKIKKLIAQITGKRPDTEGVNPRPDGAPRTLLA